MRAPGTKRVRRLRRRLFSARLRGHVRLYAHASGEIVAGFHGYSVGLGTFSVRAADRAQELRIGLPLRLVCVRQSEHRQRDWSVGPAIGEARSVGVPPRPLAHRRGSRRHRTAGSRLLAASARSSAMPTLSSCRGSHTCDGAEMRWSWNCRARARCSKFAIRRLRPPSPCCPPRRKSDNCAGRTVFLGSSCLALLLDCQILFKVGAPDESGLRLAEGDDSLALWDFHDLLFHARSTEGRHANPLGGVYPVCWDHFSAASSAAQLAREEDRSAQVLDRASGGTLASRKAPA